MCLCLLLFFLLTDFYGIVNKVEPCDRHLSYILGSKSKSLFFFPLPCSVKNEDEILENFPLDFHNNFRGDLFLSSGGSFCCLFVCLFIYIVLMYQNRLLGSVMVVWDVDRLSQSMDTS